MARTARKKPLELLVPKWVHLNPCPRAENILGDAADTGSKADMKMTCVWDHEERGLTEAEGRTGKQSWTGRMAADCPWAFLRPKGEIGIVSLGIKETSEFLSQEMIR